MVRILLSIAAKIVSCKWDILNCADVFLFKDPEVGAIHELPLRIQHFLYSFNA